MNVGSIIKYYRTKKGMTQTELAEGICSISHLSKIETNMYSANEETVGLLLDKLGLKLEDVTDNLAEMKNLLQDFITSIFMRDHEETEGLFKEIESKREYFETSEYVNLYHLYLYRYYISINDTENEKELNKILQRTKTTFDPIENNIYTFLKAFQFNLQNKSEEAIKLMNGFMEKPLPLGGLWQAEAYYILAYSHTNLNQNEASLTCAKKAYDIYVTEYNFTRQVHSQLLIGISYMRLRLNTEALEIFKPLLRNTKMFFKNSLYPSVLVNYARCLYLSKDYKSAKNSIGEALDFLEPFTLEYATALFIWLESKAKLREIDEKWHRRVNILKDLDLDTGDKYFYHHANFLEKYEFSQYEGIKYAIKYLYPYLMRFQSYSDAREAVEVIIDYYTEHKDPEKLNYYYDQWRMLISKERTVNE